ncbi:hypothetical protein Vretifemale_5628 [Volvox reticuliferus]|uniref:FCP1 homology domain-containing protein n=1 Tax=Volvox reticuliferus TaxID=1737510 RepID=A0A8J4CCD7_9CHLO|nr:hypothetical protein Vretifemale_5628 [Volvox reticuliferus]
MTSIVEECARQCLLPDGKAPLFDSLPPFDEELTGDVTVDELSLPAPSETADDNQVASGSSLPATPAERPCTFCPSSLPLPPATCPARATLVLDLDGTLIASEELNAASSAYLWSTPAGARTPDYEAMGRRVWLRPGVKEFLTAVRPHFEVVLFTAATQNWAAAAIEQLDPAAELFDVMLHRDHTTSDLMWDYVKDLSRLGRDLARVVIVDDNPLMFMYQPDNALHIGAYEAATAGGPDNVLPRVADVLINQVAPAIDVREVLGPMAVAKSCITSTVSATATADQAATEQHAHAAANAVCTEAADGMENAFGSTSDNRVKTDATNYAISCCAATISDGESARSDAPMDDRRAIGAYVDNQAQQQDGGEQVRAQRQHLGASHCSSGRSSSCESGSPVNDEVDKDVTWDGDDEGPETFDEHGTAAQLGADVVGSCHPPRAWIEVNCSNEGGSSTSAEVVVGEVGLAHGNEGQEESDACPSEEHSVHSSEDFEALMDDAMAEYDSDVYESPYVNGASYNYSCQDESSTMAAAAPKCSGNVADHAPANGSFGSDSSCHGFGLASSNCHLRPGVKVPCSESGQQVAAQHACTGHNPTYADVPSVYSQLESVEAQPGCSSGIALAVLDAGDNAGISPPVGNEPVAASPLCGGAAGTTAPLSQCPASEDAHPRQAALPTGMVFLTDLNPAFGVGCAPSEAVQAAAGTGA